jgi:DNA-binding NarL/FixJ family response regulator
MIAERDSERLEKLQQDYEATRDRVWVDRIGVGLAYRRSLREIEERVRGAREERDRAVVAAVEAGGSYREVARALHLSHSRVQQIVGAAR